MSRTDLYALISHVATGVALFVAAAGGMWGFIYYSPYSFLSGVAAAVIGLIPGVFLLLIAEGFFVLLKIFKEKQQQTSLLQEISDKLSRTSDETDA